MARIPNALDVNNQCDIDWLKANPRLIITVDGAVVERSCAFNVKEGWVETYMRSPLPGAGNGVVRDDDGLVVTNMRKGHVEVRFAS